MRLYEIFKSYAFIGCKVTITFTKLRKKLGFFHEGRYKEWKHFNAKILKPAVKEINRYKDRDIEVSYTKARGTLDIDFNITTHKIYKAMDIIDINDDIIGRALNIMQDKYIKTLLTYCYKEVNSTLNFGELTEWIISDLINFQKI